MSDGLVNLSSSPVLLIGASCRAAAEALYRLGIDSEVWDLFADRDTQNYCKSVREIDTIHETQLREVFERPRSFVLPCGGLENHADLWSKLESNHVMLGPSLDQLQKLRDPFWLNAFCKESNINFPRTLTARSIIDESFAPSSERGTHDTFTPLAPSSGRGVGGEGNRSKSDEQHWLLKQRHSGGGLKVFDFLNLPAGFAIPHDAYLQECIAGREISLTIGCTEVGKTQLLTVMGSAKELELCNLQTTNSFQYQGSFGPISLEPDCINELQRFFDRFTGHLQFVGVLQADMILHPKGLYLLEINPRWTASMELAELYQPSSILNQFRSQKGDQLTMRHAMAGRRSNYTKLICYASSKIIIDETISDALINCLEWKSFSRFIEQLKAWRIDLGIQWQKLDTSSLEIKLADIPRGGIEIATGQPICSLLMKDKPKN